jgi:hypothetical protein
MYKKIDLRESPNYDRFKDDEGVKKIIELGGLAAPLMEFIQKNLTPHDMIIVEADGAHVVSQTYGGKFYEPE